MTSLRRVLTSKERPRAKGALAEGGRRRGRRFLLKRLVISFPPQLTTNQEKERLKWQVEIVKAAALVRAWFARSPSASAIAQTSLTPGAFPRSARASATT
jgi:hypothetical protein